MTDTLTRDIPLPHNCNTRGTNQAQQRRVIDAPIRAFHWLLVLCFIVAWLSGDSEELRQLHLNAGYALIGLLAFRVLYGLFGPQPARLANFWRRIGPFPAWLRKFRSGKADSRQGANLLSGSILIAMLLSLPLATVSGLATHFEWTGDWMEEVHEVFANLALLLATAHLLSLIVVSRQRRQNVALTMVTGKIPCPRNRESQMSRNPG